MSAENNISDRYHVSRSHEARFAIDAKPHASPQRRACKIAASRIRSSWLMAASLWCSAAFSSSNEEKKRTAFASDVDCLIEPRGLYSDIRLFYPFFRRCRRMKTRDHPLRNGLPLSDGFLDAQGSAEHTLEAACEIAENGVVVLW